MLEKTTITQILDFVRVKPRTIQEIAHLLDKNWRTADRYVEQISREGGQISTRTFRSGSPGALKIAFWNALEPGKGSAYQERLLHAILAGKTKEHFSPFDIYQFVPEDKREAYLDETEFSLRPETRFDYVLEQIQTQFLMFSGNLSWMELGQNMNRILDELIQRKVKIHILTRVDVTSQKNTEAALAFNQRAGWDAIHIRHCEQPLRSVIVDDKLVTFKEVLYPDQYRELKKPTFLFYRIRDPEWIQWLQKIFWHLWNQSIDAEMRLEALKTLQKTK